ncbi:MAG: hypothetical protein JWN58_1159, partial [Gammaproteobacteria bacterium]|nr:hypothetical protein [Gammaproteobacteria bacterium]
FLQSLIAGFVYVCYVVVVRLVRISSHGPQSLSENPAQP